MISATIPTYPTMNKTTSRIPTSAETENNCYICWEGANEGDPLFRDCACKGSGGYAHIPCLISAAKARNNYNSLHALTQQWLTCNVCQTPFSEPTRSQLIKFFKGNQAYAMKLLTTAARLTIDILAGVTALYACLMIVILLGFVITVCIAAPVVLALPHLLKLYQRSEIEVQTSICLGLAPPALFIAFEYRQAFYRVAKHLPLVLEFALTKTYCELLMGGEFRGFHLPLWVRMVALGTLIPLASLRDRDTPIMDTRPPYHRLPHLPPLPWTRFDIYQLLQYHAKEFGFWTFSSLCGYWILGRLLSRDVLVYLGGYVFSWCRFLKGCGAHLYFLIKPCDPLIKMSMEAVQPTIERLWLRWEVFDECKTLYGMIEIFRGVRVGATLWREIDNFSDLVESLEGAKDGLAFWWCCCT